MKAILERIAKGTRNQSLGLLTIGASMLICTVFTEAKEAGIVARELAQVSIIAAGLFAITILFRGKRGGQQR
jgi:hypothetical protein